MSDSIRTPLGKVRGLGSAKKGVEHFIAQRASAIALLCLTPWILISLIGAIKGGYEGAVAWIGAPINAGLILVTIGAGVHHMRIGLQVVIEDYIAKTGSKLSLLILNTFISVLVFVAAAVAVLKLAIA
ncbi:MAG: succinate dehydrogenase, hydrophobic membrane anchor protein [Alphaproteobacteria bacterium]|nr:succinate dehydrogenase, hydrophobic membrane anchor protein [Alphaproteobacteria bacterium]